MTLFVENLCLKKNGRLVLKNISFSVDDGHSLSIMGPSGSGKTSLARSILGLEKKASLSGSIQFHGPAKPQLAYVAQNLALWPHLDVEQNIRLALNFANKNQPLNEPWMRELIDIFALTGLEKRAVHELSGGEQQRLALARAISTKPQFIIFDEPFCALDVDLKLSLIKKLKDLQQLLRFTAIFITHDHSEALKLSSKIITLNLGEIKSI